MTEDRWLTVQQVAAQIQVHPESVRRWLREKKMGGVLISKRSGYRIRQGELQRFLAGRATEPEAKRLVGSTGSAGASQGSTGERSGRR